MATNTLLTLDLVTRKALQIFRQSNAFMMSVNRDYQSMFGSAPKVGETIRVRKPVQYAVNDGATLVIQDTVEEYVTLTVATQKNVGVSFTSAEQVMKLDDFGEIILAPAVNALSSKIAVDIMSGIQGVPNVINTTATGYNNAGVMISPTAKSWLQAGALLSTWDCPTDGRSFILHPYTQSNTVSSLLGLLVPGDKIGAQFSKGMMGMDSLGGKWMMDQTVRVQTTGAYGALGTTNAATQKGASITVTALAGPLKAGDFVSFTGINWVSKSSYADTGVVAQFVLTADAALNATTIAIYPPLVPVADGPTCNVTTTIPTGTQILAPIAASAVYRKNFLMHPSAVTLAFAELPTFGQGIVKAARETYAGTSLRMIQAYDIGDDVLKTRLDCYYGYKFLRPEWVVCVTDVT